MNTFISNKKIKKFIIVLIVFILFNFYYPKNVKAFSMSDLAAIPARAFWFIEKGVLTILNDIFTSNSYKTDEFVETITVDTGTEEKEYDITNLSVYLTPDTIIKGKFILFDANIFKEIQDNQTYYDYVEDGAVTEGKTSLRETVSGWYYALRNLAIISLLSVLVYVGIRMIMTSVAHDKAKYKIMFKDWLIALCLLMVMHYMMIAILNITTMVVDAIGSGKSVDMLGNIIRDITGVLSEGSSDDDYTYYSPDGRVLGLSDAYGKIVVLFGILIYTFIFAVKYLKREFTIIFLILLGPISCITYPIDKISDGKAQAFNKWFSEFLYQVIIQPFHLLLYIVLIGSATELAEANVLYAILCFAVMIPAEKFIKEMFGFKDKLGSPLGAFASGALASKAISSLIGKGKGSSSSGGGENNNSSTSTQLPTKNVDKELVSGKGEDVSAGGEGQISQSDNPALGSGEEPGGGASAADAYQNSNDPVGDMEKAALEEKLADGQIDESDLTDAQKAALGIATATTASGDGTVSSTDSDKQLNENENYKKGRLQKSVWERLAAVHNERASRKLGSTSKGQRWVNRGKKLAKMAGRTARFAATTAAAGAGAATLGALGAMIGKGGQGFVAGAMLGKGIANRTIKGSIGVVTGVGGAAKDYWGAIGGDKVKEKAALKAFKSDQTQIDKAIQSYRQNHDGADPSEVELNREIEDRFELSRYGLSDDIIDRAVGSYQGLIDSGYTQYSAVNQTALSAKLAKDYDKKEFRDPAKMKAALETISQRFQSQGVSKQLADARASQYLHQAAKIKGAEIALPDISSTIEINIPAQGTIKSKLGIASNATMSTQQLERMNHITVKLRNAGFNSSQIEHVASDCAGSSITEILDRYEAKIEYLSNESARSSARKAIETRIEDGKKRRYAVTEGQVDQEMRERLVLKSMFNITSDSDISNIRTAEREMPTSTEVTRSSRVERARQFATDHKAEFGNLTHMQNATKGLVSSLIDSGLTSEQATKDAREIITLASKYRGEEIATGLFSD